MSRGGGGFFGDPGMRGNGPPNIDGMVTLKIDNIPYNTTIDELRRTFERYGRLGDVYMPRDLRSGEPRGFAFVRYMDQRDADDAIDRLDGEFFAGRELRIQYAKRRRPEFGGGGGYDGGYGGRRFRGRDDRRNDGNRRRRSRSRSRSHRRRSRSRSAPRHRSRSRSRSHHSRRGRHASPGSSTSRRQERRRRESSADDRAPKRSHSNGSSASRERYETTDRKGRRDEKDDDRRQNGHVDDDPNMNSHDADKVKSHSRYDRDVSYDEDGGET